MKIFKFWCLIAFISLLASCDSERVIDEYTAIPNRKWETAFQPTFTLEVKDTTQLYNVFLNLRNEGTYAYNNLWINMKMQSPGGKKATDKLNLTIADPTGKWLGKGLGDLYDCRIPLYPRIKFPEIGNYTFTIEQFMRINPLEGISDIGIRIEKSASQ